jgi:DNA-binding transcriptional ArsR family regulator
MLLQQADEKRARQMDKVVANDADSDKRSASEQEDQGKPTPANDGNQTANTSDNSGRDETENSVIEYLHRIGEASPQDIQSSLNLSRSTTYRAMDRLAEEGVVLRSGKTRSVRYRLNSCVKQMN